MLFPRSHAWTPLQRWLIIAAAASALLLFSALVCGYERYYRGPGEEAIYGTWEVRDFPLDEPVYFQFNADQTFSMCSVFEGKLDPFTIGKWYAGGPNIYLRFTDETMKGRRPLIVHIVGISQNEIRIRWSRSRDSAVWIWKRANVPSPNASNQAMQRTGWPGR